MISRLSELGPFGSVLDVGGNVGSFAELARGLWPVCRITSFEPIPRAAAENRRRANGRWQVTRVAISDQTGDRPFRFCKNQPSASTMQTPGPYRGEVLKIRDHFEIVTVPTRPLDFYLGSAVEGRLLVKIDVEGHEGQVIAGGRRTLEQAAAVIVEVNQAPVFGQSPTPATVDRLLRGLGLEFAGVLDVFQFAGDVAQFDGLWLRQELAPLPPGF